MCTSTTAREEVFVAAPIQSSVMQGGDRAAYPRRFPLCRSRYARVLSRSNSLPMDQTEDEAVDRELADIHNSVHHYGDKTGSQFDFDLERLLWNIVESNNNNNNNNNEIGNKVYKSCKEIEDSIRSKSKKKKAQRRVSFADSVGLDLASIRIVTEGRDTPPLLDRIYDNHTQAKARKPALQPVFPQPISRFSEFLKNLKENNVSLESVDVKGDTITGMVKVKNLAFEKSVIVRYTTDNWESCRDVECAYVKPAYTYSQQTSVHDTFSFHMSIDDSSPSLEFCICYRCQGQPFWDNNNSSNYRLERQQTSYGY